MLKRFFKIAAYLLLVLMPMQALATANMLVCNSMMQSTIATSEANHNNMASEMPCHQQMASKSQHPSDSKSPCKSTCASLCANLCALTAMPMQMQSSFVLNLSQTIFFSNQLYASITPQTLHRPPIHFI